jgi:hypothetical protein
MKFADTKRWGQLTFLDYCEVNQIKFSFDGKELKFPDDEARARASSIWYDLTGSTTIGTFTS